MRELTVALVLIIAAFEILPYAVAVAAVLGITAVMLLRKGSDVDDKR